MESLAEQVEVCRRLSDSELTSRLAGAVLRERDALISALIHIGEFDERELAQKYAYANLFEFCVRKFGYSRSGAGRRIQAARAGKRFPVVLEMLAAGQLSIAGAAMLNEHLTPENHGGVLAAAKGRNEDQIALLVASLAPGRRRRDSFRVVAAPAAPASPAAAPTSPSGPGQAPFALSSDPAVPEAASPEAIRRVSFDASEETFDLIRRAKEVLRHRFPKGELDDILRLALNRLLADEDRDRRRIGALGPITAAVPEGRYIPESIKQAVWERDAGRCAYEHDGRRCDSREWLEFDHIVPVAEGGRSTVENLRLLCREHNQAAGRAIFGGPARASVRRAGAPARPRRAGTVRGPPA
ncbi:MAG: HNH endonuclease [Elusimicrobia bacterium]|nr:HNH endonuclease [Elusimicrobiota bacterium]